MDRVGLFRTIRLLFIAGFLLSCAHVLPLDAVEPTVHLTLHVPADQDINEDLGFAILEFRKHDIQVVVDDVLVIQEIEVLTDNDRHKLSRRYPERDTIHVFVVNTLPSDDEDDQDVYRGLQWRKPDGRHFIGLAEAAQRETLAHEIGHALGLNHYMESWNIMCAKEGKVECDRDPDAVFSVAQGAKMRRNARRLRPPTAIASD